MPQVDNSVFLSIIFGLIEFCALFYAFFLVFLFCPFVSRIKMYYNILSKLRFIKTILILYFLTHL
jgi:hypothetical protein